MGIKDRLIRIINNLDNAKSNLDIANDENQTVKDSAKNVIELCEGLLGKERKCM